MEYYYCKKCGKQFTTPVCQNCGAGLKDTCYIGEKEIHPIRDIMKLSDLFKISAFSSLAFIVILSAIELALNSGDLNDWWIFLTRGGVFASTIQLFFGIFVLGLILFLFQGKEIQQYLILDKSIIKKVWVRESRVKCWFRFIRYQDTFPETNDVGECYLLVNEIIIDLSDAGRCSFSAIRRLLKIYRPFNFVFSYVYLEREDVERVRSLTAIKRLLNKGKK